MKRFKILLGVTIISILLFQCDNKDEDDLYYEPLIEGVYDIDVDFDQVVDFIIEPKKPTTVEGKFDNEIEFKIEFPEGILEYPEQVHGTVSPINKIEGLPSDINFQFGFYFTPGGTSFFNPAILTIELADGFEVADFKGFIFEGDDPEYSLNSQIWDLRMTPVTFETIEGKLYARVEIPHFSGFSGFYTKEFNCPNPRSADYCIELKEIIACMISGKESLDKDDVDQLNKVLREWMEEGLKWLEENPSELDEDWEFYNASKEFICWRSAILQFNNDQTEFEDLIFRAGDVLTKSILKKISEENELCSAAGDVDIQRSSFEKNFSLLTLIDELELSGFVREGTGIDMFNYCNGIGVTYLNNLIVDTTKNFITTNNIHSYKLTFPPKLNPPVARSIDLRVYGVNLIGDIFAITPGVDYEIIDPSPESDNGIIINGANITEKIIRCGNIDKYYPCYDDVGGFVYIRLLHGSERTVILDLRRSY